MDYLAQNLQHITMVDELKAQLSSWQIQTPVSVRMLNGSGIEMKYKGVSFYHPEQPVVAAAADIQRLQGDEEQDLVVYFGLGFGIHAEFLKKRFNAPLLIFEPSLDILKNTLSLRPLALDNLMIESNFGRLAELVDRCLEPTDRRFIVAMHPGYQQAFPREFERFKFVVQEAAKAIMIRHNTLKRGATWARFEIENMRQTVQLPPVTELKKYATGVPGIFVGAGPSLNKNASLLKAAKGKAIIIAASTALRTLDKAGVQPDVAMVIESNPSTYQFQGLSWLDALTLAPTPYSHPENFKIPTKRKMSLLNRPTPTHDWMIRAYDNVDAVTTASSVALVAFSTLHYIGCDPIIAIGMDLAFTGDQSHADGADSAVLTSRYNETEQTMEYIVQDPDSEFIRKYAAPNRSMKKGEILRTQNALRCAGWGGGPDVYSGDTFTSYRAWLEGAAETWAGDRTLINATEGGASIHGFEEISLATAIERHLHNACPVAQWLDEIENQFTPRDLQPLRKEIENELALVRRVTRLASECETLAANAIKLITAGRLENAQRKLDKLSAIEKELGGLTRKTRVLNQISQQAATNIRLNRHEDKHVDEIAQTLNALKRSITLFKEIKQGSGTARELFEYAMTLTGE